jgi:hypothetical protein
MRVRYALGVIIDVDDDLTAAEVAELVGRLAAAFPEGRQPSCMRMGWSSTDDEPAERHLYVIRELPSRVVCAGLPVPTESRPP